MDQPSNQSLRPIQKKEESLQKSNQIDEVRRLDPIQISQEEYAKRLQNSYHTYISDMLCDEEDSNPKKFWSYIKSKPCENSAVSRLMKDAVLQCDSKSRLTCWMTS